MSSNFLSMNFAMSELVPADVKAIMLSLLTAVVVPPYSFYSRRGSCNKEFWLCLFLTIIGYVPGIIYAVYTVYSEDISEAGREVVVRNVTDD